MKNWLKDVSMVGGVAIALIFIIWGLFVHFSHSPEDRRENIHLMLTVTNRIEIIHRYLVLQIAPRQIDTPAVQQKRNCRK